jgi:predicted ATPase
LREGVILRDKFPMAKKYPFSIPSLAGTSSLSLSDRSPFLRGRMVQVKSTLLEAMHRMEVSRCMNSHLIAYEETTHYQLTRRFLENRNSVFRELFAEDRDL